MRVRRPVPRRPPGNTNTISPGRPIGTPGAISAPIRLLFSPIACKIKNKDAMRCDAEARHRTGSIEVLGIPCWRPTGKPQLTDEKHFWRCHGRLAATDRRNHVRRRAQPHVLVPHWATPPKRSAIWAVKWHGRLGHDYSRAGWYDRSDRTNRGLLSPFSLINTPWRTGRDGARGGRKPGP